jgi:hypothetical protein
VAAAVLGVATKNNAFGVAGVGSHDLFAAGSGVIGLVAAMDEGPPTADQWFHGDLIKDFQGNLFVCVESGEVDWIAEQRASGQLPISSGRTFGSFR